MKSGACPLLLLLLWGVSVSCTRTLYVPVERHHTEAVVWRDTLVEVVVAGERQERKTLDTVSVLHTRHARSTASVSAGVLEHTLVVYPRKDSVSVQVRDLFRYDSLLLSYPLITPSASEEEVPRWVEMWAVAATLAAVVMLLLLLFRKPMPPE